MTFDDDDLDIFAVVPKPAAAAVAPEGPVASWKCVCGFRDEVKTPNPPWIACSTCKRKMERWEPLIAPPAGAGRELTDAERARMNG